MIPNFSSLWYHSSSTKTQSTEHDSSRDEVKKFSKEEIDDYKEAFKLFDIDRSGDISEKELNEMLKRFGCEISEEEVRNLITDGLKKAEDNDGKVDFEAFLAIMSNVPDEMIHGDEECELKFAFNTIDADKSGTVSFNEVRALMEKCGLSISKQEVDLIMKEYDTNGDGEMDFEEFKELLNYAPGPPNLELRSNAIINLADVTSRSREKQKWKVRPIVWLYLNVVGVPLLFSIVYSVAILFPPDAREKAPTLLWADGFLVKDDKGFFQVCPRSSICSVGIAQIVSIAIARLTAFSSYVMLAMAFVSKMHSTQNFLSSTNLRTFVPFEDMHQLHSTIGVMYTIVILMHIIAHLARWGLRGELLFLGTSREGLSGAFGMITMMIVVLSMTLAKRFKEKISFEIRLACHWFFILFVLCICFHTTRCRNITCIFFLLWVADYLYTYFFKTHCLDIVEFTPLPSQRGAQMLWRNPKGFDARSGQYVKIQIPWLSEGGREWHPFSVYLKEKTEVGRRLSMRLLEEGSISESWDDHTDIASGDQTEFMFVRELLAKGWKTRYDGNNEFVNFHAREDQNRYDTTQVFIAPVGNWSQRLNEEISEGRQRSSCWVRGPFNSPFSVGNSFSHLVLTATGIGITPSLATAAQYPGQTRTKILIWSCKCAKMLKFFAPLFEDFHMIIVYYTGKERISHDESLSIKGSNSNVFLQMERGDMSQAISTIVTLFESSMNNNTPFSKIEMIPVDLLTSWCVMYCGGSKRLRNDLASFCRTAGVQFSSEVFDW